MYPSVTSDKAILQASRTLLQEQGWTALNIRSVAAACGVSVGSIYNRFGSKSQLVAGHGGEHLAGDLLPSPGPRGLCGPALLRGMAVSAAGGEPPNLPGLSLRPRSLLFPGGTGRRPA